MQPAKDQEARETLLMNNGVLQGTSIPMSTLVTVLGTRLDNPVIDRTGLKGLFDIRVQVKVEPSTLVLPPAAIPQVLAGLGLKVESARVPVQTVVIERVEKPTEKETIARPLISGSGQS